MSLRIFDAGVRLVSILVLIWLTSFPGRALAFEYERELASQHLDFVREAALGKPRVAGVQTETP